VRVVRNLAIFNGAIIVLLVVYAHGRNMSIGEIIPWFSPQFWRRSRSRCRYVYAPRRWCKSPARLVCFRPLVAVDEAATLDVLCSDKTDTNSQRTNPNRRHPEPGFDDARLLAMAALAFRWRQTRGYRDPCCCHESKRGQSVESYLQLTKFVPFDPATRSPKRQRWIRTAARCAS